MNAEQQAKLDAIKRRLAGESEHPVGVGNQIVAAVAKECAAVVGEENVSVAGESSDGQFTLPKGKRAVLTKLPKSVQQFADESVGGSNPPVDSLRCSGCGWQGLSCHAHRDPGENMPYRCPTCDDVIEIVVSKEFIQHGPSPVLKAAEVYDMMEAIKKSQKE
jgi:hypothetical protein